MKNIFKVLTHNGKYVDMFLLVESIEYSEVPYLFPYNFNIDDIKNNAEFVAFELEFDNYQKNVVKCTLTDVTVVDGKYFDLPDVRNKLGPIKNLISMIENNLPIDMIMSEIKSCKKNIEYLSKEN